MSTQPVSANQQNGFPVLLFSSIGHLFNHVFIAFYFVIVLALEVDWRLPYYELIELWTLGALMVGVAALPAGLLGDRIGAPAMMVMYFVGMGLCAIGAGSAGSTTALLLWLTGIGTFAAIYHPVCIPWLVRSTTRAKGKALAFNGIFGSLGGAAAGITAGWLIDISGWQAAFIVPGVICTAIGAVLQVCIWRGLVVDQDREIDHNATEYPGRELLLVFGLLTVTMFLAGMIYYSTQTALPKLFALRHEGLAGSGTFGIGLLVAGVYAVAALMQLIGGGLADRYPLKYVYAGAIFIEIPLLVIAAESGGVVLLVVAMLMVSANAAALPAENMLLARYTPEHRHGLAFGAKFVLAFGAGPLAVLLVSFVQGSTGEFYWLFIALSGFAVIAFVAATLLPRSGAAVMPRI